MNKQKYCLLGSNILKLNSLNPISFIMLNSPFLTSSIVLFLFPTFVFYTLPEKQAML